MAKDGVFFKALAKVHPKFQTPHVAIYMQAGMAIVLLLAWKTFHNLITYVTFIDMVFLVMGALCLFIFRRSMPDHDRPFRVWFYPFVPGFFILIGSAFIVSTLIAKPIQAWAGLAVLGIGGIVYFLFQKFGTGAES